MQEGTRARGERGSRRFVALQGPGHEAGRLADRTCVPGEALTQRDDSPPGTLPERRSLAPAGEIGHLHLAITPLESIVGDPELELCLSTTHGASPSFQDDADAVPVRILDVEDRAAGAGDDRLLNFRDLLARQAGHPRQREPPERDRDPQVDDSPAALLHLDARVASLAGLGRGSGAVGTGIAGERRAGRAPRLEALGDRRGLVRGEAPARDELQDALEWIAHRGTSSSWASCSVACATVMSPRSRARRMSRRPASAAGSGSATGGRASAESAAALAAASAEATPTATCAPASRGSATCRSPETERKVRVGPGRPTISTLRPGSDSRLLGRSLDMSPVIDSASTRNPFRATIVASPLIERSANGPLPAISASR